MERGIIFEGSSRKSSFSAFLTDSYSYYLLFI